VVDKRAFDPIGGRFAAPVSLGQVCISIPVSLIPHILGVLEPLKWPDAWAGDDQLVNATTGEIESLIARLVARDVCAGGECPECPECPGCAECPDCPECPEQTCGGGLVVEGEDMGQVVTDITYENGVFYKWFGPCCKQAITDLASIADDQPEEVADDPLNPNDGTSVVYSACGKAWAIVETIYLVGETVWENNLSLPFQWVGKVEDAIPGNNDLDDNNIISAFLTADIIRALGVDQAEVFDAGDKADLLCLVASLLSNDKEGITRPQWDELLGAIVGIYGTPIGNFWRDCADAIGPSDMRDITRLAAYDLTRDCSCGGAIPAGVTTPDAQGWYLGENLADQFSSVFADGAWEIINTPAYTLPEDAYGTFLVVRTYAGLGTVKRRNALTAYGEFPAVVADLSAWTSTSDHLESLNQGFPLISSLTTTIRASLAAQRGYLGNNSGGTIQIHGTTIATPPAAAGQTIAASLTSDPAYVFGNDLEVVEFRYVHNTNSPSHGA